MESDGNGIKNREVRTVKLEFTDAYNDDGTPGLLVTAKFEPEIKDQDDLTISQKWGRYILEAIISNSATHQVIDVDLEEGLVPVKKSDPNSTLN